MRRTCPFLLAQLAITLWALSNLCLAANGTEGRMQCDLDGPWGFATDPDDRGETEQWYLPSTKLPAMPRPGYAPEANGTIRVPGIWDNQGYGVETDKVRHNFVGKGWYKRTVDIPASWNGQRIYLVITGISRYSKAWVDDRYLGEHIGFLSAFEYDITDYLTPGRTATITIEVDSLQRWEVDAMYGTCSFTDYMDVAWGGIWGHVRLEARADTWLSDPFIQTDVPASACTVTATLNGRSDVPHAARLQVFDANGQRVADTTAAIPAQTPAANHPVALTVKIPQAQLWTPDSPTLYTATLSLCKGNDVLDTIKSRFGMRQFTIDGHQILLNGQRIMLRGYGDDHIYPEQMAMPSDKELHLRQLRIIKSFGFNHVRHHSTMMPPEYYDACDELGIICNAEFPIVYSRYMPGTGSHWQQQVKPGTTPDAANETYRREWSAAITRFRNHPSVFCWVMGNELYGGSPLRSVFQQEKKRLDPGRFFADSDGVWGFDVSPALAQCLPPGDAVNLLAPQNDRDSLDLYFMQVVDPLTYNMIYPVQAPKKPIVVHEMGNFLTFTRPDIIDRFQHNIKPFWLTAGREKLRKLGLEQEAAQWAEKSERLYALLHKCNVETVRKNPFLSGYHWWLFQDYWTTSNGLVDLYFRPKSIKPQEVLKYNDDIALLQDGLARTYRGRDKLRITPVVSNFSADAIRSDMLCEIRVGDTPLAEKRIPLDVAQGSVYSAAAVELELPNVAEPTALTISARLANGKRTYCNDWSARLYPAAIEPAKLSIPLFVCGAWSKEFAGASPLPLTGELPERAVYITEDISDPRILTALERGAAVALLGPSGKLCPSRKVTFGTTWWKAGDSSQTNHTGTLVYRHPLIHTTAPDGWCDEGWYDLLEGGSKFILDNAPSRPNILIRALPSMVLVEEAAIVFEVGVGKGCLIASGLNHQRASGRPENQWFLKQLVEYAGTLPHPQATWPVSFLSEAYQH